MNAMSMITEGMSFINEPDSTSVNAVKTDVDTPMWVKIGNLLAIMLGFLGALLASYMMWFFGWDVVKTGLVEDVIILEEVILGFILMASFVFVCSGSAGYYMAGAIDFVTKDAIMTVQYGGVTSFDLYITVHSTKNILGPSGLDGLFRDHGDLFVELKCGRLVSSQFRAHKNGGKATCISPTGVFEEEFHFVVTPTDEIVRFTLKDMNLIGDETLGEVDINIAAEIISDWPQKKAYRLHAPSRVWSEGGAASICGTLVLSFLPAVDKDTAFVDKLKAGNELAYKKMDKAWKQREKARRWNSMGGAMKSTQYGSMA
jgi:hypothetical protein